MDPGSSALLLNIIQLTVLIVGLTSALALIKNGSKLTGQLMNKTDQLSKQFGLEKGLNATRGGIKNYGKNKALNAEARMASSDSRLGRGVGGFRTRRSMKQKNRERIRGQALEEGYYKNLTTGTERQREEKRAKAVGMGGRVAAEEAARLGRQAEGYATAKEHERFGETVKFQEAILSSASTAELKTALEDAIRTGNDEKAHAAANVLVGRGKSDAAAAGEVIRTVAGAAPPNSDQAKSAASLIRSHGADFNAVSPDLTKWATQDPNAPTAQTLNQTAATASTYTGASAEKMATWSNATIDRAHAAAHAAGAAGGTEWATLQQQANAVLADPQQAGKLTPEAIKRYTDIANGMAPPPPSDRRLKKNISQIGVFGDIPLYRFQYRWGSTEYVGTMAQDIKESHANAVSVDHDGYYRVDYSQLGFSMMTHEEWLSKKK